MHTQTQTYYLARKTENFIKQDPYKTQQAQQKLNTHYCEQNPCLIHTKFPKLRLRQPHNAK